MSAAIAALNAGKTRLWLGILRGKMKMSARAVHSPLHLDLDIAFCPAAAGQNFPFVDKGQRFGQPVYLACDQTAAAGAAVAFTTLIFDFYLMCFKRHQQRRVLFPTQYLSAGKT